MKRIANFKQKALRIFRKNGGDGKKVRAFDNFPKPTQLKFIADFCVESGETPIISGFGDDITYFVLTDQRLLVKIDDTVGSILLSGIDRVQVSREEFASKRKMDWKTLDIYSDGILRTSIQIDEKLPFFGLWNVLLFVASNSTSSEKTPKA